MVKNLAILVTVILFALAGYMLATAQAPESCASFICTISHNIVPLLMVAFALFLMISVSNIL